MSVHIVGDAIFDTRSSVFVTTPSGSYKFKYSENARVRDLAQSILEETGIRLDKQKLFSVYGILRFWRRFEISSNAMNDFLSSHCLGAKRISCKIKATPPKQKSAQKK